MIIGFQPTYSCTSCGYRSDDPEPNDFLSSRGFDFNSRCWCASCLQPLVVNGEPCPGCGSRETVPMEWQEEVETISNMGRLGKVPACPKCQNSMVIMNTFSSGDWPPEGWP